MKVNIFQLIIWLIMLFIPVNFLKDLFEFPIMLIVGGATLLLIFILLLLNLTPKKLTILFIPLVLFVLDIFIADDIERHIRYFINWYSLLCIMLVCSDISLLQRFKKAYIANERGLNIFLTMIIFFVCILLMLPQSYSSGWWGLSSGFTAFSISHAVAAASCVLGSFILLYSVRNGSQIKALITFFIAVFAVFQTGARVYVISIGILLFFYIFKVIDNQQIKVVVLLIATIFVLLVFSNSAFKEKMEIVLSYQATNGVDYLDAVTSGRTTIWFVDIENFFKSKMSVILFGGGFSYSYYINRLHYGMDIFSHNIFIETLLSVGIVGMIVFLYSLREMFKLIYTKTGFITMFVYIVLAGFLNGLMDSQIYCFSMLIICLAMMVEKDKNFNELKQVTLSE